MRARGLKLQKNGLESLELQSRPMRARGLKQQQSPFASFGLPQSRPMRARGLKLSVTLTPV